MKARDGHSYRVIYPGRPADGAGPDFRDAVLLRDDGKRVHGHVEIHVRTTDWHGHGHTHDPAYNGVVLHVALEDGGNPVDTPSGLRIPLLVLGRQQVRARAGRKDKASSSALPAGLPDERDSGAAHHIHALPLPTLDMAAAGDEWFRNRSHAYRLQFKASGVEQALWEGALECLGYPTNKKGFRQLAARLSWAAALTQLRNCTTEELEALFEWAAGFAPGPERANGISLTGRKPEWNRRSGRPANSPRARLKAVAAWAIRWRTAQSLSSGFVEAVKKAEAAGKLGELFVVRGEDSKTAPLGPSRARDIVVNHLLPSVHALATGRGDRRLARRAEMLFKEHPKLSSNTITREASLLLAARGVNSRPSSAREQQGLIHIYRTATASQRGEEQLPLV